MAGTHTHGGTPERERSGAVSVPAGGQVCGRDRAVLRAIAAGRCWLRTGCEPLLVVDGVACADSGVARRLIVAGLVAPPVGVADRARLTPAGRAALGLVQA
jgi:hypothetical protein